MAKSPPMETAHFLRDDESSAKVTRGELAHYILMLEKCDRRIAHLDGTLAANLTAVSDIIQQATRSLAEAQVAHEKRLAEATQYSEQLEARIIAMEALVVQMLPLLPSTQP